MRCYICDKPLVADEVNWHSDHGDWDPCGTCLSVIKEVFGPLSEDEIDAIIGDDTDGLMIDALADPEDLYEIE